MEIGTFTPDKLIAGEEPDLVTKPITIKSGAGVLARGTLLGQVKAGAVPTTGTAGSNTGTGVCQTVTGGRRVKVGAYTLVCKVAVGNGGVFEVRNPEKKVLGLARVGEAFTSDEINLSLTDATDFVVGDSFTITVPAATTTLDQAVKADKANVDGSGVAAGILAEDVDASTAAVATVMYEQGMFNSDDIALAAGNVIADHSTDLRALNCLLRQNQGVNQ